MLLVVCLLVQAQTQRAEIVVMTSGTFTAAHLELAPEFERSAMTKVSTATTSMGVGADSIPSRLKRGDAADVVIVNADALDILIKDGLVLANSRLLQCVTVFYNVCVFKNVLGQSQPLIQVLTTTSVLLATTQRV